MSTILPGLAAALLALSVIRPATAQAPTGVISGTVTSSANGNAPIIDAAVGLHNGSDSTLVATITTNTAGFFSHSGLPAGSYYLVISSLGFQSITRNVSLMADSTGLAMGTIRMDPAAVMLEGVIATGKRSPVVLASDRSIYTIRDMPLAQGGGAIDAMRAIPELQVDIDDNIRARGGEPLIFLDGRPLPMQGEARLAFLRSLRADRIDRIEYIPNPSAAYEAEGQSGIVNIVLRRDVGLGVSGSLSANAGTRGTQNLSGRINLQQGMLTLFGGASMGFNQTRSSVYSLRENLAVTPTTFLQETGSFRQDGLNGGVDLTAELKLSERVTGWGIVRGGLGASDDHNLTQFIHRDAGQTNTDWYERERERELGNHNYFGAIGFRRVVEAQRNEMSAELRYSSSRNDTDTENARNPFTLSGDPLDVAPDMTRIGALTDETLLAFQIDVQRPLSAATRLDFGYRGNFRLHNERQKAGLYPEDGEVAEWELDERFRYDEDSHAGYFNIDQRLGRIGFQAGLRVERVSGYNTATPLEEPVSSREMEYFPSANIAYDLQNGRKLRLAYSRRVQRPSVTSYNPINTSPADLFNRTTGNPLLTPAYLHVLDSDLSWTGDVGTLRLNPFYAHGEGFWISTRTVDTNGISTMAPENVASASVVGAGLSASVRQVGPFSGFVNVSLEHVQFDAGASSLIEKPLTNWHSNANVTATLPGGARLQMTGGFSPAQVTPDCRSSVRRQLNLALTQNILQDRGMVTLSVVDPFDLAQNTQFVRNASVDQMRRSNNRVRRATLSVTYNFGRAPESNRRIVEESQGGGGLGGS